jgi:hypothetical protein
MKNGITGISARQAIYFSLLAGEFEPPTFGV